MQASPISGAFLCPVLTLPEETPRLKQLRAALLALGSEENKDLEVVRNGTSWKLRWFDHTIPEQPMQGDELANAILKQVAIHKTSLTNCASQAHPRKVRSCSCKCVVERSAT